MRESQYRSRTLAARSAAARTRRAGAVATSAAARPRTAQAIDPALRDRVMAEMHAAGGPEPAVAAAPAVLRRWRVEGSALFPGRITEIA